MPADFAVAIRPTSPNAVWGVSSAGSWVEWRLHGQVDFLRLAPLWGMLASEPDLTPASRHVAGRTLQPMGRSGKRPSSNRSHFLDVKTCFGATRCSAIGGPFGVLYAS